MHHPEPLSQIPAIPLSALFYVSNFNSEELASNHRAREISASTFPKGTTAETSNGRETSNLSITNLDR